MLAGHRVHLVDTPTHITVKQTIGGANVTETKNEAAVRIKKLASQRQRETEREREREPRCSDRLGHETARYSGELRLAPIPHSRGPKKKVPRKKVGPRRRKATLCVCVCVTSPKGPVKRKEQEMPPAAVTVVVVVVVVVAVVVVEVAIVAVGFSLAPEKSSETR